MLCAAACHPPRRRTRPSAPIAHRWSRSSGSKNARRGLTLAARSASRPTRSQVLKGSGENAGCATILCRTPLLPQGDPISPDGVTVTGTRPPQNPQLVQFEGLPPGIEIIIEGTRVQRGSPTYTPEQPVPPIPRGPVQSPVNPSTTPPPGNGGWIWWQMMQLFFRGLFNGSPSVVTPIPTQPTDCSQQLCA